MEVTSWQEGELAFGRWALVYLFLEAFIYKKKKVNKILCSLRERALDIVSA